MLSTKEVSVKKYKINWTDFLVVSEPFQGDFDEDFETKPCEYLLYAKEDYSLRTKRGYINAMSNVKRAIDCQIDLIIKALGYDYKKFDDRDYLSNIKKIINQCLDNDVKNGLPDRLKLIHILEIAPTFLISKIRNMRNKIEHEYIVPSKLEASEAIEIADLFILASSRNFSYVSSVIYFGDRYVKLGNDSAYSLILQEEYFVLNFNQYKENKIQLSKHYQNNDNIDLYSSRYEIKDDNLIDSFLPSEELYFWVLKILFTKEYELLPKLFGHEQKKEHIKYSIEYY